MISRGFYAGHYDFSKDPVVLVKRADLEQCPRTLICWEDVKPDPWVGFGYLEKRLGFLPIFSESLPRNETPVITESPSHWNCWIAISFLLRRLPVLAQVSLIRQPNAIHQRRPCAPAELCEPADIEQLLRRAVRP